MSFFSRFKSSPYSVIVRRTEGGILVGRTLTVEIDFTSEVLDDRGLVLPEEALGALEDLCAVRFADKLLVDNNDPHADNLVKLKRIGVADPVLFDYGTSGAQLAFYVGRHVEEWLGRQKWNSPADDPAHISVALCTVKLGNGEFFYDIA